MPRKKTPSPAAVFADIEVDPLLVGADRDFLATFPRKAVSETGVLPLRRYGGFGLAVVRSDGGTEESLARLQRESDVRLMGTRPLHPYGFELFLRYWDAARDSATVPPIWMPEERRTYLTRLGELASLRGRTHPVPLLASLVLTSPLNHRCPALVVKLGREGQVLFLGGAGGLQTALRFPAAWHDDLLARLKIEFDMDGSGRGGEERGLHDLKATVLPPLKGETLILEPKGPGKRR